MTAENHGILPMRDLTAGLLYGTLFGLVVGLGVGLMLP